MSTCAITQPPDAIVLTGRRLRCTLGPTQSIRGLTKSREVAIYEANTRLSELVAAVEQGEQVTITRRGQPVAKLVAIGPVRREASQR